jgi:hypothetical protein
MAKKSKTKRDLKKVGQSQRTTETATQSKFAQTEGIAKGERPSKPTAPAGRISPQLSCTIEPDDKASLNELTLYLSNKAGRPLNTSNVIRTLIRYGTRNKESLEPW